MVDAAMVDAAMVDAAGDNSGVMLEEVANIGDEVGGAASNGLDAVAEDVGSTLGEVGFDTVAEGLKGVGGAMVGAINPLENAEGMATGVSDAFGDFADLFKAGPNFVLKLLSFFTPQLIVNLVRRFVGEYVLNKTYCLTSLPQKAIVAYGHSYVCKITEQFFSAEGPVMLIFDMLISFVSVILSTLFNNTKHVVPWNDLIEKASEGIMTDNGLRAKIVGGVKLFVAMACPGAYPQNYYEIKEWWILSGIIDGGAKALKGFSDKAKAFFKKADSLKDRVMLMFAGVKAQISQVSKKYGLNIDFGAFLRNLSANFGKLLAKIHKKKKSRRPER